MQAGVFEEEAALKALFDEYIGNPLVEHAEEEPLEVILPLSLLRSVVSLVLVNGLQVY